MYLQEHSYNRPAAITVAMNTLQAGDVLMYEMQTGGATGGYGSDADGDADGDAEPSGESDNGCACTALGKRNLFNHTFLSNLASLF